MAKSVKIIDVAIETATDLYNAELIGAIVVDHEHAVYLVVPGPNNEALVQTIVDRNGSPGEITFEQAVNMIRKFTDRTIGKE